MKDVYLTPTPRLFKPTFILHNLRAVIRLSLPKQTIYHTGWVDLVGVLFLMSCALFGSNKIHGSNVTSISKGGEKKSAVNAGSCVRIPITIGPLVA